ncbi:MAG: hypothetical protein K2Q45_11095 [Nitrosomonas sp.]|nr:hypothetical protein [Nitrosomonas sp.]
MTDITLSIDQLASAIAQRIKPVTPLDRTPWNADECAAYLRVETKTFIQYYAPLPSFPRPIKAETTAGRSHPRWNAQKVIDWFFAHEEESIRRRKPRNV